MAKVILSMNTIFCLVRIVILKKLFITALKFNTTFMTIVLCQTNEVSLSPIDPVIYNYTNI